MSLDRRSTRRTRKILRDLYDPSAPIRWAAVQELGDWAEAKWEESPANVRDLVRRLAWSLNDESGATGWGAPEAMAEILARVPDLVAEFAPLYPSYLSHEDVYLGHDVLDTGSLWALGRLGPDAPFRCDDLAGLIRPFLAHESDDVRGVAAWTAGRLGINDLRHDLALVSSDPSPAFLLIDGEVAVRTVEELAAEALAAL